MSSKNKVKTTIPAPTAQETRLQGVAADMSEEQLKALTKQGDLQNLLYGLAPETVESLSGLIDAPSSDITDELVGLDLDRIRNAGVPTAYEQEYINQQADEAIGLGLSDIGANLQSGLMDLREREATSRGLRATDTPIMDRGEGLSLDAIRQGGNLVRGVRTQQGNQLLQAPLDRMESMGSLSESLRTFQEQLRSNAATNRLNLINAIAAPGLGLASTGNVVGTMGAMSAPRLASGTKSADGGFDWASTASGLGSSYLSYKRATV